MRETTAVCTPAPPCPYRHLRWMPPHRLYLTRTVLINMNASFHFATFPVVFRSEERGWLQMIT